MNQTALTRITRAQDNAKIQQYHVLTRAGKPVPADLLADVRQIKTRRKMELAKKFKIGDYVRWGDSKRDVHWFLQNNEPQMKNTRIPAGWGVIFQMHRTFAVVDIEQTSFKYERVCRDYDLLEIVPATPCPICDKSFIVKDDYICTDCRTLC